MTVRVSNINFLFLIFITNIFASLKIFNGSLILYSIPYAIIAFMAEKAQSANAIFYVILCSILQDLFEDNSLMITCFFYLLLISLKRIKTNLIIEENHYISLMYSNFTVFFMILLRNLVLTTMQNMKILFLENLKISLYVTLIYFLITSYESFCKKYLVNK